MATEKEKQAFDLFIENNPFLQGPLAPLGLIKTGFSLLPEKPKQQITRTYAGMLSPQVRSLVDLGQMITKPSKSEAEETEEFLRKLGTALVGEEHITTTQRGYYETGEPRMVTDIARPESTAANIARDVGAFTTSLAGVSKVVKPLQAIKAVQKAKAVAPKTTGLASAVARGEIAAQLSIDPYRANFANIIGDWISDDNEGWLGIIEEYLLEPVKSSQEKTQLENRIGLLAEGLVLTGVVLGTFKAVGFGARKIGENKENILKTLKQIKNSGKEPAENFFNTIKNRVIGNQDLKELAIERGGKDIEALKPGFISKWFSNVNLQYSRSPVLRGLENIRVNIFTSRGTLSSALHERTLKTKNINEKWDATIKHTAENLDVAYNKVMELVSSGIDITKYNKEELWQQVNKVLFTNFKVPTIITTSKTGKGRQTFLGRGQKETYKKELKKLPKLLQDPVRAARDLQDNLSKMIVDSNILTKNQAKEYMNQLGIYVKKAYQAFENPNYVPDSTALKNAKDYIRSDIIHSPNDYGFKKGQKISEAELNIKIEGEIENILGGSKNVDGFTGARKALETVNPKELYKRIWIPQELRTLLGEFTDPVSKIINSTTKLAHYVENMKLYDDIFDMGNNVYIFKEDNIKGFQTLIGQGYGKLSGKYTSKNMATYLTEHSQLGAIIRGEGVGSNIWRGLVGMKSWAQEMKTVISHATHFKNFGGMNMMSFMSGVNPYKYASKTAQILKTEFIKASPAKQQALFEEVSGYGLIGKGAVIGDLRAMAKEINKIPRGAKGKRIANVWNKLQEVTGIKWLREFARKVYVATDDWGKVNMWYFQREFFTKSNKLLPKGTQFDQYRMTELQVKDNAAKVVRSVMPNYDLVPRYLQRIRTIPFIGQFFSFNAEAVRISVNNYAQGLRELKTAKELSALGADKASNLWRSRGITRLAAMTVVGGFSGKILKETTQAVYGIAEDVYEAAYSALAEYDQNDQIILIKTKDGELAAFNFSSWDVTDYPKKPFQIAIQKALNNDEFDEDALIKDWLYATIHELYDPFLGESITQRVLSDYVMRQGEDFKGRPMRNPFTGEKYIDYGKTIDNLIKNLPILVSNLAKVMSPGSADRLNTLITKIDKNETDIGQTVNKTSEYIRAVFGVNFVPLNNEYLSNLYGIRVNQFANTKGEFFSEIFSLTKSDVTTEEFLKKYAKLNQRYYDVFKDFNKLTSDFETLGVNTTYVKEFESTLSSVDKISFFNPTQRFVPLNLSIALLNSNSQLAKNIHEAENLNYAELVRGIAEIDGVLGKQPVLRGPEDKQEYPSVSKTVDKLIKNLEQEEEERQNKTEGGLVKGVMDVPSAAPNPADRKLNNRDISFNEVAANQEENPYTEEMEKLGLNRTYNELV